MTLLHRISSVARICAELTTALLSFLLFKLTKFAIRTLYMIWSAVRKDWATQWRFASEETLAIPGVLATIMTTGPRWNTHAIVATVGPIAVTRSIALKVDSADRSARSWTIVVCTFPGYRTVTSVSSLSGPFFNGVAALDLQPGRYWIGLRYYRWSDRVELPAISVDGFEVVHAALVPCDLNEMYQTLSRRENWFYYCLQYYMFILLQYRWLFPAWFVEKEFLPLANPETRFYYGALRKGDSLGIRVNACLLSTYDVYVTLYDRASFPISCYQVTELEHLSPEIVCDGMYLVRVHNMTPVEREFDRAWVELACHRSGNIGDHSSSAACAV